MLTNEQKKEYLKNPKLCPFCKSTEIVNNDNYYGEGDLGNPMKLYCVMECEACKECWADEFVLVGVSDSLTGEN